VPSSCGDDWCEAAETNATCPEDCFAACMGAEALCARRYDQVFVAGAHNANVSLAYGFPIGNANQSRSLTQQLEDGIRHLDLDVDYCLPGQGSGEVCLCHGDDTCLVSGFRASLGLDELRGWLDAHPSEVLTLNFESYVDYDDLVAELTDAGVDADAYRVPHLGENASLDPWPYSLGNMARRHDRVVIFAPDPEPGDTPVDWITGRSRFEKTPFGVDLDDEWPCADPAPAATERYGLEHVRSGLFGQGDPSASTCANATRNVLNHLEKCGSAAGRPLQFAIYDFYETNDGPFEMVNLLNGVDALDPSPEGACDCHLSQDCAAGEFCLATFCTDKAPDGTPCTADVQCESDRCVDLFCRSCESGADCSSDQSCGLFSCQDRLPNGNPCADNQQCQSGICNHLFCIGSPQPYPAPCTTDAACQSGFCDAGICAAVCPNSVCEAPDETCYSTGPLACQADCGACPNGTPCIANGDCASGRCAVGFCAPQTFCGDFSCNGGETCSSCVVDCGPCCELTGSGCSSGDECCSGVCTLFDVCL
jgi:hypothetical protein